MAKSLNKFEAEQSELVKQLEAQLTEKDNVLKEYKKEHGQLEIFFKSLLASVGAIKPSPVIYVPSKTTDKTICHAVAHITDGHMGATQEPDEIEGFNEFNPDICRSRQIDFAKRFCKYIDNHRNNYIVNECHVLVTGDMISGNIHQELQITNAFPVTVQIIEAAKLLAEQMDIFSQNFSVIHVHFIGEDNHGRLTKKPQSSQGGLNSFNYLVGVLAESYTQNHPNINWNIYPMYQKVVNVAHRNYLITHAHGIRGWAGYPWYGIERKVSKESTNRMQLIMEEKATMESVGFHKFIFGHFHVEIKTGTYLCGPSVQGTTAYDHKEGRYGPPGQVGWLVHPKYNETGREFFEL